MYHNYFNLYAGFMFLFGNIFKYFQQSIILFEFLFNRYFLYYFGFNIHGWDIEMGNKFLHVKL